MSKIRMGQLKTIPFSVINFGDRSRKKYEEIDDLALSIQDKGLLEPIVVDQDFNILAGGRRYKAIEILKWSEVPVNIVKVLDNQDALEIELIENLVRKEFHWTEHVALIKKIDDLYRQKNDGDWSQAKTAEILESSVGAVNQKLQLANAIEQIPELAKLKSEDEASVKMNQIYERAALLELDKRRKKIGKETTIDSLLKEADKAYNILDVFKGLKSLPTDDERLVFAEIDPPFGIDLKGKKRLDVDKTITEDYIDIDKDEYVEFLSKITNELSRVLAPGGTFVFWFGIQWYAEVCKAFKNSGLQFDFFPGIWYKGHGQVNQRHIHLARTTEFFIYGRKSDEHNLGIVKKGRSNLFEFATVPPQNKIHPTQRPTDLIEELIKTFCISAKGTILVPFMGSGITYVVAKNLGYDAFGWDLVPEYKEKFLFLIQKTYNKRFKI